VTPGLVHTSPTGLIGDHPVWCTQVPLDCDGRCHQASRLTVPIDLRSGEQIQAGLWGDQSRTFVEVVFTPASALEPEPAIGDGDGAGADPPAQTGPDAAGDAVTTPAHQHPDDPVAGTDPHAHDLTITQAETLHQALGYLLALARTQAAA
jgi:hypothetical protein